MWSESDFKSAHVFQNDEWICSQGQLLSAEDHFQCTVDFLKSLHTSKNPHICDQHYLGFHLNWQLCLWGLDSYLLSVSFAPCGYIEGVHIQFSHKHQPWTAGGADVPAINGCLAL